MAASTTSGQPKPASGGPLAAARKSLMRTFGFTKGYNLAIFLIFGGLTALFSVYRLRAISLDFFCIPGNSIPGECLHYSLPGRYQTGIWLHLASVLPASLLALTQFVPAIRRRALNVHRYAGYAVWVLSISGSVGMIMLVDKAAGGSLETQAIAYVLTALFLGSTYRAYTAIRELRIDQHREWMLRAWIYAWCIVTMRPIFILLALAASKLGNFHLALPCDKIEYVLANAQVPDPNITLAGTFPDCAAYLSGADPAKMTVVRANLRGSIVERTAALNMSFGTATWVALIIHAVLLELYLHYTAEEDQRLKKVSHQKRLAAGLINPTEVAAVDGSNGDKKTS
ncbi:hypothetical protein Micbo1qcDRAFT_189882 [Microdochium bolleyi]|uniref:Uncharacterized protein n=1 Tax=Microdochium bolleyi TaxID=196109 RepID=A0A136IU21_9PEZI|nr:hypothetical protein Micbo1qcDRAFT_189882 [Microdochium bolleyi]